MYPNIGYCKASPQGAHRYGAHLNDVTITVQYKSLSNRDYTVVIATNLFYHPQSFHWIIMCFFCSYHSNT